MTASVRAFLIASIVGCALAVAPSAFAGTYTVYGCSAPGGENAPLGQAGWADNLDSNPSAYWSTSSCPHGPSYLWMAGSSSHPDGEYAEEDFFAPGGTTIRSYSLQRAVGLVSSGGYYYQLWDEANGQWHLVEGCASAAGCAPIGNSRSPSAASNRFSHTAEPGTTRVSLKILCGRAGGCPSEKGGITATIYLWQAAITLQDNSAPTFDGTPSGPLMIPGSVVAGLVPVSLTASDVGGGVYQAILEVDGRIVASQTLGSAGGLCQSPFIAPAPCQTTAGSTLDLNTAVLPDGAHNVTVLVSDPAGNVTPWGPVSIRTSNNRCSPSPAAGGSGLTVRPAFAVLTRKRVRRHRHTRMIKAWRYVSHVTTSYATPPVISGRLTTAAGAPVVNAAVCVAARDDVPGARLTSLGTLTTSSSGMFRYRPPAGPSRSFYIIDRVPGGAVSGRVDDHVRVPVNVHVNSHHLINGQVMTWRGRLPGPVPRGLLAVMQVWRGTYWESFEQLHVAHSGRWVGKYRFSFTTSAQHYTFRLDVPVQSGYPYASGHSRLIGIDVRS